MLVFSLSFFIIAVALTNTLNSILISRITTIIFIISGILILNIFDYQGIDNGINIYSDFFQVTSLTQAVDAFICFMSAFILIAWAPHSTFYLNFTKVSYYPIIAIFTSIGASFLISSINLISIYLSLELQSFGVYIIACLFADFYNTAASLKYFLLGGLSSALIVLGSALIYSFIGLTSLNDIYIIMSINDSIFEFNSATVGIFLIFVGFLFKVSAAPFHNWAPDVYNNTRTIITIWLTIMPKISILILILQITLGLDFANISINEIVNNNVNVFDNLNINIWNNLLLIASILSLIFGTILGLAQTEIKRLIAYSTVSHIGFILLALSINSEESIESLIFYLMQYSFTNLNVFIIILAIGYINSRYMIIDFNLIANLSGFARYYPVLAISFAISLFSIAGVPPIIGFFAKQIVLYSAMQNGNYFMAIFGIIVSIISAFYYIKIIRLIYFNSDSEFTDNVNYYPTNIHSYFIAILTIIIMLFTIYPNIILNSITLITLSIYHV